MVTNEQNDSGILLPSTSSYVGEETVVDEVAETLQTLPELWEGQCWRGGGVGRGVVVGWAHLARLFSLLLLSSSLKKEL